MPSLQIRAGSASSRRKRESSLLCKISTFSLVKAAGPNSWRKNPSGGVPVLELDDGSYLAESVAICHYLEGLHPEPNLFGRDLREQAQIEMWNRRMELELFAAIGRTVQNTSPIFQGRSAACGRPSTTRTDGSRAERTAVCRWRPFHD